MEEQETEEFFPALVLKGIKFPPFPSLKRDASKLFDDMKNLEVKKGDVLLSSYPKTGTHFCFELLYMLQNGKAEYSIDLGGHFIEVVDDVQELANLKYPRVLVTHFPYQFLPEAHREHGAKLVHIVRNPKDVIVSLYYHLLSTCTAHVPWTTFIENFLQGKQNFLGGWFAFEREFEEATRNNKNAQIHTVYYEDIKLKPVEELRKLTAFLELKRDENLLKDIAEKCQFSNMKEANESVKSQERLDRLTKGMDGFQNRPNIYRKGIVGDWKNLFTVAQNEKFNELIKTEMKDSQLKCLPMC